MKLRKILILIILSLIVTAFFISGCKPKEQVSDDNTPKIITPKTKTTEFLLLYEKIKNDIHETTGNNAESFNLHSYEGGAIVKRDGSENKNLKIEGYLMGHISSKLYENYYYISSPNSPLSENYGYTIFDFNAKIQNIYSSDINGTDFKTLVLSTKDKFPGCIKTSPKNKYLAYVMTSNKIKKNHNLSMLNPFLTDSTLIIRNIETQKEITALDGKYNRQLFKSFLAFSEKKDVLYTIEKTEKGFRFVEVNLTTGEVKDFKEVFPSFNWDSIKWGDFFETNSYPGAYFFLSPDETRLVAYRNFSAGLSKKYPKVAGSACKLWGFKIPENKLEIYYKSENYIQALTWKPDSTEFAFVILATCSCNPNYQESDILKMDKDGLNLVNLVKEKQAKINNVDWSPDNKEIGYSVYGIDYVGRLKSVFPDTKEVKEILNSIATDGAVNKKQPTIFYFINWVEK